MNSKVLSLDVDGRRKKKETKVSRRHHPRTIPCRPPGPSASSEAAQGCRRGERRTKYTTSPKRVEIFTSSSFARPAILPLCWFDTHTGNIQAIVVDDIDGPSAISHQPRQFFHSSPHRHHLSFVSRLCEHLLRFVYYSSSEQATVSTAPSD